MKGLFIFFGECFREGMHMTRLRDTEYGYNNQKECCLSQIKLIKKLKKKYNCDINIAINTYDTIYKTDLLKWYNEYLIYYNFTNNIYEDLREAVKYSVINVMDNIKINDYDFLFVCRNDLYMKDKLIEIFNPYVNKLTYINIEYIVPINSDNTISFPHIADPFCIIPKKYFYPFNNWKGLRDNAKHLLFHQAVRELIKNGADLQNDIGFISNIIYAANTSKQRNPFYRLNCRPEPDYYREIKEVYVPELNRYAKIDN